ncbi:MAG: DegT/DnrJ/EryC1/StrS family aminotransferase [Gemmatimonadales bacterium]
MSALAIHGGRPVRTRPFPPYQTIGAEERAAVLAVLDSGVLSQFVGVWGPDFLGGPRVRQLEAAWSEYFGTRHAVSMNSATSGLYAAVGAARVAPGDEVIVSPYTMSASAAAAIVYGAIPVFADIDPETFCLDPRSVAERITSRTRAIIGVDLFGHPAPWVEIRQVVAGRDIVLIEDAAQAPGARLGDRYAGTLGDIGVFSLNYHKTIHSGEGGVVVTDDDDLAERLQLIRNHGEAVVKAKGQDDLVNLIGFNYRMTEIEAAIAREQLRKLESLVAPRVAAADYLTRRLEGVPGLRPPMVRPGVRHGYYVYPICVDPAELGTDRRTFATAVRAEGVPIAVGYVEPIYRQPMYQRRIGFGAAGFPFRQPGRPDASYPDGLCPVAERMHERELCYLANIHSQLDAKDLEDIADAIEKVALQIGKPVTV